ncbi:MAG TPA: hypothetical protein VNC39_07425 [Acidocella sp.]|jgi:hypothetical protein|uniref:hypothetical protein n=1 Tax=Acidocella sp. TaxID=50710 RepID=UPI002B97BAB9|nr:hypothetical protein [Acidocella sp.]HVE21789.1 hypothetical protein [Acidocella sp.]
MRWFYPMVLLGLATSSVFCGKADAQLVVTDPTADPAEVADAASDAITAAKETEELEVITSKEADALSMPDPDPVATTASLQSQLVTPTPTAGNAEELYSANTAEATENATTGDSGEQNKLAVATNLDGAALNALDDFAAQATEQDTTDVTAIDAAPNEEALLGVVADEAQQDGETAREDGELDAMVVLAESQNQINEAQEAENETEGHKETSALLAAAIPTQ